MSNDTNMDKPRTGVPTEAFKDGWERIFGKKKVYCGSCGIDRTEGAMCEACTNALAGCSLNRKRQIMEAGDE